MKTPLLAALMLVLLLFPLSCFAAERVPLSSLDLTKMTSGWGTPQTNRNIVNKPMVIAGKTFEQGVGTHANSILHIRMDGSVKRFIAMVGVDDETQGKGTIRFQVIGDDKKLFDSGLMRGGDKAKEVNAELSGIKHLILMVTSPQDGVDYDHADWANAFFLVDKTSPAAVPAPTEEKIILTPKPGPEPRINGPRVFGGRPGRPFLYRIPCTGTRPLTFVAADLPSEMQLNPKTGIITGTLPLQSGRYTITLSASNTNGKSTREFSIVVGDTLALTPPMGWNSWYIHYNYVTEQHMRQAADAMIDSGMADYGYMYVSIDDCWMKKQGDQPYRDEHGAMLTNDNFPDIQGMCDYIHDKGLRAGIYTSPGRWTCAGYVGTYGHEQADLDQFAQWGFDFLKYDWCSYEWIYNERMKESNNNIAEYRHPYQLMGDLLKQADRDIVYNICQYGMGEVWKWAGDVEGNCWRTTGDLGHVINQVSGFYSIGISNMEHAAYARPGRWNDPDYLIIGWVGGSGGQGKPTSLTGSEQYSYMSMWCLMASPLFFSGDMAKLDEFTLNVLCNAEVIEVDQDELGRQANVIEKTDDVLILAKPMHDGSLAVGLFNLTAVQREITAAWSQLSLSGTHRVRDLWRQKDLSDADTQYTAVVAPYGVSLVRLWPKQL
jgi:alpha-galactosidase